MKLNIANKIYITIACILLIGIIYKTIHYKPWARYFYFASICAADNNPVYVRDAYFLTSNEGDLIGTNKEEVNRFYSKWGHEYYFPETYNSELLPEKLVLEYAEYKNKIFYKDTITLPKAEIEKYFKEALRNHKTTDIYKRGIDVQGLTFLVGIANDGNIALWLRGKGFEKTIMKKKLHPIEPNPKDLYYDGEHTKADYLKRVFSGLDDSLKVKIDEGWNAQANYIDSATHYLAK